MTTNPQCMRCWVFPACSAGSDFKPGQGLCWVSWNLQLKTLRLDELFRMAYRHVISLTGNGVRQRGTGVMSRIERNASAVFSVWHQ